MTKITWVGVVAVLLITAVITWVVEYRHGQNAESAAAHSAMTTNGPVAVAEASESVDCQIMKCYEILSNISRFDCWPEHSNGPEPISGNQENPAMEVDPDKEPGRFILNMLAAARAGDDGLRREINKAIDHCTRVQYALNAEPPPEQAPIVQQQRWLHAVDQVIDQCGPFYESGLWENATFRGEIYGWDREQSADILRVNELILDIKAGRYGGSNTPLGDDAATRSEIRRMMREAFHGQDEELMEHFASNIASMYRTGAVQPQLPEFWPYSDHTTLRTIEPAFSAAACEMYGSCESLNTRMFARCIEDWYTCMPPGASAIDYLLAYEISQGYAQATSDLYQWILQALRDGDMSILGLTDPGDL